MNERGEHIRFTPSPDTLERMKDIVENVRKILGETRFDCVDGRESRDFPRGETFDATTDKTSRIGFDLYHSVTRETDEEHRRIRMPQYIFWPDGDPLEGGSLAWKYPNAIPVESWETPAQPPQPS